jgi:hypothetical protein
MPCPRRDAHRSAGVTDPLRSRPDLLAAIAGDVGDAREALQFAAPAAGVGEDQHSVHRARGTIGPTEGDGEAC